MPAGSLRLQAWLRLGVLSRSALDNFLDIHLPVTAAVVRPSILPAPAHGGGRHGQGGPHEPFGTEMDAGSAVFAP